MCIYIYILYLEISWLKSVLILLIFKIVSERNEWILRSEISLLCSVLQTRSFPIDPLHRSWYEFYSCLQDQSYRFGFISRHSTCSTWSLVLDLTWDLPCLVVDPIHLQCWIFDRIFDAVGQELFRSVGPNYLVGFDTDSTGHGSADLCSHFYYHRSFQFILLYRWRNIHS